MFSKLCDRPQRATGEKGLVRASITQSFMGLQWRLGFANSDEQMMEFSAISARGTSPGKRAFHSCSVIGGVLYIFGGISDDRTVLSDMFSYDVSSNTWTQIENRVPSSSQSRPLVSSGFPRGRLCTAPSVSHHTATVVRDRFILVIGGWNGRKRCADVYLFDTVDQYWRHIPESGDVPVGLSSHTATVVSLKDILIIGREGGVRTQRRFAGAFYLNYETGRYTEAPFHASSRSGHTANLIPIRASKETHLFVFGGRNSGGYELISSWNKIEQTESSFPKQRIINLLEKSNVCDEPSGRQHAKAVEIGRKHLLIFGGETWSGVRENVTNDAFILETDKMRWYKVPCCGDAPKLVGHSVVGTGDKIFIFGGGVGNRYCNTLWEVKF